MKTIWFVHKFPIYTVIKRIIKIRLRRNCTLCFLFILFAYILVVRRFDFKESKFIFLSIKRQKFCGVYSKTYIRYNHLPKAQVIVKKLYKQTVILLREDIEEWIMNNSLAAAQLIDFNYIILSIWNDKIFKLKESNFAWKNRWIVVRRF